MASRGWVELSGVWRADNTTAVHRIITARNNADRRLVRDEIVHPIDDGHLGRQPPAVEFKANRVFQTAELNAQICNLSTNNARGATLVRSRVLNMIDHQNVGGHLRRFELQPKLFTECGED